MTEIAKTIPAVQMAGSVSAAQLITLATNVNDQRIIAEAMALAHQCEVMEPVAAIAYEPGAGSRAPKLVFTTYRTDEEGARLVVHDDGSPYDPQSGKPYRAATKTQSVTFRGQLPVWWPQAVRTRVLPPRKPGDE